MEFFEALFTIVLCVLMVAIIVSNTFCIIVLWKVRSIINEAPQVLMTSLSLADLLNGLICVLPMFLVYLFEISDSGRQNSDACRFQAFLLQIIQVVKVTSLLALNFDRYIAVTRALRYHNIVTVKRVYIGVAALWILSLVSSLIYASAVDWKTSNVDNMKGSNTYNIDNVKVCVFQLNLANALHWLDLIVLVILPLIVTVVIYIRLSTLARHHAAQIGVVANGDANGDGNHDNQQRLALQNQAQKASKTTRVMTLVFAVTCTPFVLAKLVATYMYANNVAFLLNTFLVVSFCSGLCNIVVYFCRNGVVRAASKAMLRKRLLPCQQILLSWFTRARQFFSRICTRNNQRASQLDPEVQNAAVPSLQSNDNREGSHF
ncbi:melanocyte-stimulating hormone receptor-like [Patiria miniata]|uniref:G-protein coupled receptors family 1 profile domain-containing protein n=1 Tax=Patiria miniata TaxID=46514 RepID=A0A914AJL7_PATMI|nr:melanocyte-stimulating hormone receptor-like [Patiria miniata]